MDKLGFTKGYFTELQFLNERSSWVYTAVFFLVFILKGGLYPLILASLGGLVISIILNRFVLNKRSEVPPNCAVLITGCSTGIGKTTACDLAQLGFVVFATVRKEADGDIVKKLHKNIIPVILDVTKVETIDAAVIQVENDLKAKSLTFLGLINNAGYGQVGLMEASGRENGQNGQNGDENVQNGPKIDSMRYQYDVNVFGVIELTNRFLPLLRNYSPKALSRETKLVPKIINITSVMGKFSTASSGIYAGSKFALEAINDSYRVELAKMGIQVVCVEPGAIASAFQSTVGLQKTGIKSLSQNPQISDNVKKYYEHALDQFEAQRQQQLQMESPPSVVSNVLCDVMLSPQPHIRYVAGKDGHILTSLLPWIWPTALDSLALPSFKALEDVGKDGKTD